MTPQQVVEAADDYFVDFAQFDGAVESGGHKAAAVTRVTALVGVGLAFGMLLGRSGR